MNQEYTVIQMTKHDYFALPDFMRQVSNGAMVLARRNGMDTFVRVEMLE